MAPRPWGPRATRAHRETLASAVAQVKTQRARLEKSTNKHHLSDQQEKLALVDQIATAIKDMASLLGGGKVVVSGDVVEKVNACDAAGVTLSSHVRAELLRARVDHCVQRCRYLEVAEILSADSAEVKSLQEAGLSSTELQNLCMDTLEGAIIGIMSLIPEEHTSKQAGKQKEEIASFLGTIITQCSNEKFLASKFKKQAEADWHASSKLVQVTS